MSVNTADTTATSSTVKVIPASGTAAIDYDKFVLTVCQQPGTEPCPTVDCLPGSVAACLIDNLSAGAQYSVTAVGVQGAKQSLPSVQASFFARYP